MPPSPRHKQARRAMPVATKTKVASKTKIALIGVGLLALGLAGYGFGFIPGIDIPDEWVQQDQEAIGDKIPPPPTPICTLVAEPVPDFRQPAVLIPSDEWHALTEYRLAANEDDVLINRIHVNTVENGESFAEVGVFEGGRLIGIGHLPSGRTAYTDIAIEPELRIPRGMEARLRLAARLAPIVPYAITSEATRAARSGMTVELDIPSGARGGEWDDRYAPDNYNISARCAASDRAIFAPRFTASPTTGQRFVVRSGSALIEQLPLESTALTDGTQAAYRFQVSANRSGEGVALKKIVWLYNYTPNSTASTIGHFRLLRNGVERPLSTYRMTDTSGYDLTENDIATSTSQLALIFSEEEHLAPGVSHVYTIEMEVVKPRRGGSFRLMPMNFLADLSDVGAMGYLTDPELSRSHSRVAEPNIDTDSPLDGVANAQALLLWSDLSESRSHSPRSGTSGGSRDWIADTLEGEELLGSQTLSR